MSDHFFEIIFHNQDWQFDGRDDIEDPLDEALSQAGVGEVTGGGSGMGICNVDVDATDFDAALSIIRAVLAELEVAPSTQINYYNVSTGSRQELDVYS